MPDPMRDPMTPEESAAHQRYHAAAHAMQSAVTFKLEAGYEHSATIKHMRVGVNSAMSDSSALATLLVRKGLLTRLEYFTAIAEGMEREAAMHADEARKRSGMPGLSFL